MELLDVLKKNKTVSLFVHNHPDPDALAAAFGLRCFLTASGFHRVTGIFYSGLIGRAENREMIRLLRIHMVPTAQAGPSDLKQAILIDGQPFTGNVTLPREAVPVAAIDHHAPRKRTLRLPFTDIRPHYGACSTIIYEYLASRGIAIPAPVATAFCYGIASETRRLGREGIEADRSAYLKLLALANLKKLSRIEYSRLSREFFAHLARVLRRIKAYRNFVCADLDELPYPDFAAEMADFMLRIEGITWSLCLGRFGPAVHISIRSSSPRADAAALIRRILPRQGKGGGHSMIAGGQIPVNGAADESVRSTKAAVVERALEALHFKGAQLTALIAPEAAGPPAG